MKHLFNISMLLAAMAASTTTQLKAEYLFRGIPLIQQGNELSSPVLGREGVYGIDLHDDFNRTGALGNSMVDGFQIGFVPPFDGVPDGPLTGAAADLHGRWMPANNDEYVVENGAVHRQSGAGPSVACLPWRVFEGLGDDYLIESKVNVAMGEEVRIAYFGDVQQFGAAQGLDGRLGQLVLSVRRGSGATSDRLSWTVFWDVNGTQQQTFGSRTVPVDEEIKLQLGWEDENDGGADIFDAWLETSTGNSQLAGGSMNVNLQPAVDIFGIGFEIRGITGSGTLSTINGFTAAVPEPAPIVLAFVGIAGLFMARKK